MKAVFSFTSVSENSKLASARIARFIAKELKLPLITGADGDEVTKVKDVLILINGPYLYCKDPSSIAKAIRNVKKMVWVENDYDIIPPNPLSPGAKSTYRASWRLRHKAGLPLAVFWSTVKRTDGPRMVHPHVYVNWNQLTTDTKFTPLDRAQAGKDLFYYGAYRKGREDAFDRYFGGNTCDTPMNICTSAEQKFRDRYPRVNVLPTIPEGSVLQELTKHGLGLYIEDRRSHKEFHSPANRFYEMLSAGLPMVFQPEAVPRLGEAGFDVEKYVVRGTDDIAVMMKKRKVIAAEQRAAWMKDYVAVLRKQLRAAWRQLEQA